MSVNEAGGSTPTDSVATTQCSRMSADGDCNIGRKLKSVRITRLPSAIDWVNEQTIVETRWSAYTKACLPKQREEQSLLHDLTQPVAAMGALLAASWQHDAPIEVSLRLDRMRELVDWMAKLLNEGSSRSTPGLPTVPSNGPEGMVRGNSAFPEWCKVDEVVDAAVVAAATTFAGRIRYRRSPSAEVVVFPVALRRAVGNLLDNAIYAAGADGFVELSIRVEGDSAFVEVEDDGPGFGRVCTRTGMGFGVVTDVVADCGGKLEIGPSRLGGAMVRLVVPLASWK